MKASLPTFSDLELYLGVCDYLEQNDGEAPLYQVADRLGRSPATVSACLSELEQSLGRKTLIHRGRREGFGPITPFGQQFLAFCKDSLRQFEELSSGGGAPPDVIRVATTSQLHRHALPGATVAHLIRLHDAGRAPVSIHIDECDYREMIEDVSSTAVDFGVGWAPEGLTFPNVDFDRTLMEVPVLALIPDPAVLEILDPDSPLLKLFTRHPKVVPLGELADALEGKTLALVKSDHQPELRALLQKVSAGKTRWFQRVEDVVSAVRRFEAQIGWAPSWYQERPFVEKRRIRVAPGEVVSKKMAIYTKSGKGAAPAPKGGEHEALSPAEELIQTFQRFLKDENLSKTILDGQRILPEEIVAWARKNPLDSPGPTERPQGREAGKERGPRHRGTS